MPSRRARTDKGQGLVEFALVVPVLMFLFLGVGTLMILFNYTGVVWNTSN